MSLPLFISYNPQRRDPWKPHGTPAGVRAAIRWDRGTLRIFALDSNPHAAANYREVPRELWGEAFGLPTT